MHLPDTEEGDNGGVHINSGIPNKAFYLVAVGLGGYAEAAGLIWYEALKASTMTTQFQEFADTTYLKAGSFTARAALNRKRCWLDGAMSASDHWRARPERCSQTSRGVRRRGRHGGPHQAD